MLTFAAMKQWLKITIALAFIAIACKPQAGLNEKLPGHWTDYASSEYESISYEYIFKPDGSGTYTHSIVSQGGPVGVLQASIQFAVKWELTNVNRTHGQLNLQFYQGKKLKGNTPAEAKFIADMIALKNGKTLTENIAIDDNGKLRFLLGNNKVKVFTRKN